MRLSSGIPALAQEILLTESPARGIGDTLDSGLSPDRRFFSRYVDGCHILQVSLDHPEQPAVNLTPEFISACDPSVSFDGEEILFAGRRNHGDRWQIWRMRRDGTDLRQITRRQADCVSPLWVGELFHLDDPAPTDRIVFVSTESPQTGDPGNVYSLYGCDTLGNDVDRLTFNLYSDCDPEVLPNGRIVYTSWRATGDPAAPLRSSLLAVSIDGTDAMPFYGNFDGPPVIESAAYSPDDRVYFVESDSPAGGQIAYVSRRRPLKTHAVLTSGGEGVFLDPRALPNGRLLASYRGREAGSCFALYAVSPETGDRLMTVRQTPGLHCTDAQVLAPHPKVRGRATVVDRRAEAGEFYCLDVSLSDRPELKDRPRGTIRSVRVLAGNAGDPARPKVLGTAPVEKDGSFHIAVPASTPVAFQLLDDQDQPLLTQTSWTWVMPGEKRGCIGCHENRELAPPNRLVEAVTRPAVPLGVGKVETVEHPDTGM